MADLKISSFGGLTTVAGDDEMVIVDKSDTTQAATGTTKKVQVQEAIQDVTHAATEKTTPVDADEVGLVDSAASYVLKRLTWANIKTTLKATDAEITTGTETEKFISPKELADATGGKMGAAWGSWTPTWTNLSVGNGTVTAEYIRIGKTVHYKLQLTFGSTTSISGAVSFSPPVNAKTTGYSLFDGPLVGQAQFIDSGTAAIFGGVRLESSTKIRITAILLSGSNLVFSSINATNPFTWTTSDIISISGTYEAA